MDNNVLSFILGVLSSLSVWWVVTHFLSPKIYFNEKIFVKLVSNDGDKRRLYIAKFWNGNNRAIIDVDVYAYVEIKNNIDEAGQNKYLDISVSKIPRISSRTSTGISVDFRKLHESLYNSVSDDFGGKLESLEKAMSDPRFLGLYIVVCGVDEFSGARRMFTSKAYNFDSFQI